MLSWFPEILPGTNVWQVVYIGESGSAGWRSNLLLFVDLLGLLAVVLVVLVSVLRCCL